MVHIVTTESYRVNIMERNCTSEADSGSYNQEIEFILWNLRGLLTFCMIYDQCLNGIYAIMAPTKWTEAY
jgi:hypothetical protein